MSSTTLAYEHLDCSESGRPVIAGKNFKVAHLVREHVAYGWSAEELALNHPQLTLGEIYSALAYYADHREAMEQELTASEAKAGQLHGEPRHRRVSTRLKAKA
jgi:uncharacterized protein (DUF433 family)